MEKNTPGYFLIIDPQKNTLRISVQDEWLIEPIVSNIGSVKKHKTMKELLDEVRRYVKDGGFDAE